MLMERYSRQIMLEELGTKGQEKLARGKVLLIGAGGIGSPAALYLTAAGVGLLGIVDSDSVEISNLQRQILHSTSAIGVRKTESAKKRLSDLNPDIEIKTYSERIDSSNIIDIINDRNYDFIIEATDNFAAKFLINDACVISKKPFSHGGINGFRGQTLTYVPEKGPCFRCLFGASPHDVLSHDNAHGGPIGVIGVICGIIGSMQAAEAIKYILGMETLLNGEVLSFNALTMETLRTRLERNKACQVCGDSPSITGLRSGPEPAQIRGKGSSS